MDKQKRVTNQAELKKQKCETAETLLLKKNAPSSSK